jgi:hypothetical protein
LAFVNCPASSRDEVSDKSQRRFVDLEGDSERFRDRFGGQIVNGGTQTSGHEYQVGAVGGLANGIGHALKVVADHDLAVQIDAGLGQYPCQEWAVGIYNLAQQQFGSH